MRNCAESAGHGAGRAPCGEEGDRLWCDTELCCAVGSAFLPELQLLLEPPSSHSRESLGYLQPPRTAVLAEWASLDVEINPRGNAAEQEGI